jgi:holo-[acyl-carrier protein] synthase
VIAGIGIDVVDCARFAELLKEPGTAFSERVFTPQERAVAHARPSGAPHVHLAARYAAKEACVKAISQALAPAPLPAALADLSEIEIICDTELRPYLALRGRVRGLAEQAGIRHLHVSLSHDGPVATAFVLAER